MSAFKGAGAKLNIGTATAGAAATATAATNALPCVVTATNTFSNGDIIVGSTFVGITGLNNRAFVASAVSGSSVTLSGVDTSNTQVYGTYTSGGSLQKYTMALIANLTDISGFAGQPSEIDVTNLQSVAKEFVLGLQDFGTVDVTGWLASGSTDAGQAQLRTIKTNQALWPFSLTLSDGTTAAFLAYVKQFSFEGVKPEGAVGCKVVLRLSNAASWFS